MASARAALSGGDFVRAQELFIRADQEEIFRDVDNAEARAYVGWTSALIAWSAAPPSEDIEERRAGVDRGQLDIALLALRQSISIDPTYADPYCFVAIIEYNFRGDADAALPFVEQCEAGDPPAEVAGLVTGLADVIRSEVDA